jgi:hypothetical protein
MKVNWNQPVVAPPKALKFDDLALNETFRNTGGRGAVYVKVQVGHEDDYYMYELATGRLWEPTTATLERVAVDVNVTAAKPRIY